MKQSLKIAIETYQCAGCVLSPKSECYKQVDSLECIWHLPGGFKTGIGTIFSGLPKGFNRVGPIKDFKLKISDVFPMKDWEYDKFNIPVWKYLDKHKNTLVRGLSPRLNQPFLHIYIGNVMDKINCLEITDTHLNEMD